MPAEHLATYLNDHLSGSVTALELLEYLEKVHDGRLLESWFSQLRADIAEDRTHLEALMKQRGVSASVVRKAMAWLAEKAAEAKLRADDPDRGSLLLLEALDALSIGIEGKRLLWKGLSAAGLPNPPGAAYATLEGRAQEQRQRVEIVRLEAAKSALGDSGTASE